MSLKKIRNIFMACAVFLGGATALQAQTVTAKPTVTFTTAATGDSTALKAYAAKFETLGYNVKISTTDAKAHQYDITASKEVAGPLYVQVLNSVTVTGGTASLTQRSLVIYNKNAAGTYQPVTEKTYAKKSDGTFQYTKNMKWQTGTVGAAQLQKDLSSATADAVAFAKALNGGATPTKLKPLQ